MLNFGIKQSRALKRVVWILDPEGGEIQMAKSKRSGGGKSKGKSLPTPKGTGKLPSSGLSKSTRDLYGVKDLFKH